MIMNFHNNSSTYNDNMDDNECLLFFLILCKISTIEFAHFIHCHYIAIVRIILKYAKDALNT